jgi:uncharacterized protein YdaU (DUF1376 family)
MSDLRALPYYKWFWQDWRANRKAQRMNYIERGLYRELLDECWVEGSIPNDLNILAEICGCPNDVMANAWQVLESCFKLVEDVYINEKMESLRTEKDTERLIKALNGKKGGVSKSLNIKEEIIKSKQVLASAKQVLASANIEEKRREENINTYTQEFELFWKMYSKPVGKVNAFKEWNKLKPSAELIKKITEKAKAQAAAIPESKFRKDAERWIRDRRWEDEIVAKPFNDIFSPVRTA